MVEGVVVGVDEAVEACLGPVEGVGDAVPAGLDGLDFLQEHFLRGGEEAVNAALDAEGEVGGLDFVGEGDFLRVACGAGALETLVAAGAGEGAARADEAAFAAEVAGAEGELDELADLDGEDGFGGRGHGGSFGRAAGRGNRIRGRDWVG